MSFTMPFLVGTGTSNHSVDQTILILFGLDKLYHQGRTLEGKEDAHIAHWEKVQLKNVLTLILLTESHTRVLN